MREGKENGKREQDGEIEEKRVREKTNGKGTFAKNGRNAKLEEGERKGKKRLEGSERRRGYQRSRDEEGERAYEVEVVRSEALDEALEKTGPFVRPIPVRNRRDRHRGHRANLGVA